MAADGDDASAGFGDARGDDAHTGAGDEFYADARVRIDGAQVVDELSEILDAVNIVMGRRGDEGRAGGGVANAGDVVGNFAGGELAAFAGLRALGHFDFKLFGVDEIAGGDSEAAGGDLLDFIGSVRLVAKDFRVFAAFAGVAAGAEEVHGFGEGAVRFGTERAERHGLSAETRENGFRRFDLFEGNRLAGSNFQKVAEENGILLP